MRVAAPDLGTDVALRAAAAAEVLARRAAEVDREGRFPAEGLQALREQALIGYFVPREFGGLEGDAAGYCAAAAMLGEECLSTAVTWAMHGQQVAVLADTPFGGREAILARIAREGLLVASVTSEYGKGGELLRACAPLADEEGRLRVVRSAPVVSYGREAAYFLITMRGASGTEPVLVLVGREDGEAVAEGEWKAMGMRGTQSIPMRFDALVDPGRVVGDSFREIAARTMIPIGHLGWSAAWLGGARGAFRRVVKHLRNQGASRQRDLASESLRHRLSSLRVSLDLLSAMVADTARRVDALRSAGAPPERYRDPPLVIALNSLKVGASQLSFSVVDGLMEICGLFDGYLEGGDLGLDRVFRDLRSASLMYSNERLLQTSGNLIFVEGGRL